MAKKVIRYRLERHKWADEVEKAKKQRKIVYVVIGLCVLSLVVGFGVGKLTSRGISTANNKAMQKLQETYRLLEEKFYFKDNVENFEQTLMDGALKGMVEATGDKHTDYFDEKEAQAFTSSMEGSIVGIGVSMYTLDDGLYMVNDVIKDSPAQAAGIQAGDQLSKVNGEDITKYTLEEIVEKIKGEEGTKVKVTFLRNQQEIEYELVRKKVSATVFSHIYNGIGVLQLNSFAQTSGLEVELHLNDFKKQGISNLIIDLRDNGGGYLSAAQHIISCFVKDADTVLFQSSQLGDANIKYKRQKDVGYYEFDKLVLLVNGNSASASEVMVSALKGLYPDTCTIVGETTYGKGTVQITLPYTDGSMLKYTTAEWLSLDGKSFNGEGIKPDIEAKQPIVFETGMPVLKEDQEYRYDSVSEVAKAVQVYLNYLGYAVEREDGYFSYQSSEALKLFQAANGLQSDGVIRKESTKALFSKCLLNYRSQPELYDTQLIEAIQYLQK